jgi:hypothetical protein
MKKLWKKIGKKEEKKKTPSTKEEYPTTVTMEEADLECSRHPVDCSTCLYSECCPKHSSPH